MGEPFLSQPVRCGCGNAVGAYTCLALHISQLAPLDDWGAGVPHHEGSRWQQVAAATRLAVHVSDPVVQHQPARTGTCLTQSPCRGEPFSRVCKGKRAGWRTAIDVRTVVTRGSPPSYLSLAQGLPPSTHRAIQSQSGALAPWWLCGVPRFQDQGDAGVRLLAPHLHPQYPAMVLRTQSSCPMSMITQSS